MDVYIKSVEAMPGYRLRLGLSDGRTVERDLSDLVPGPDASPENVFIPWRDPAYFAQVQLADYGTAVWPNGVDLDPDVLIWGMDAHGNLLRRVDGATTMPAPIDWSQCPVMESVPGKVSGAWVLKDTRFPVATIFANLGAGASVAQILEWYDVEEDQVRAVIAFVITSLELPPRY